MNMLFMYELYMFDMQVSDCVRCVYTYRWLPTKSTYILLCNCSGNGKQVYFAMPHYIAFNLVIYTNYIL